MKYKSILLSTYINTVNGETYALFGPEQNLLNYFFTRFEEVYMIRQPMPAEKQLGPSMYYFRFGELIWKKAIPHFFSCIWKTGQSNLSTEKTSKRLKIRDFLSNFYFVLFCVKYKINLFIGVESINALAGALLKKIGKIDKVLYFANDYHPNRYSSAMNWIFLKLDEIMAYSSDYMWMMNPMIHTSRIQRGLDKKKLAPHFIIHGGLPFFPNGPIPLEKRKKFQIVYATRAGHGGLPLVIQAFGKVIKNFNDATLYITGNAYKEESNLLNLIDSCGCAGKIVFTGFLLEKDLNDLVKNSYIGIAIWPDDIPVSATYGDPEKIRRYFHFGLPVVTTRNAFTADILKQEGAGIVVDSNSHDIARAISDLFFDMSLYFKVAAASKKLGESYMKKNILDDSINDLASKAII